MQDRPDDAPAPWWKCAAAALPELLVALQFLAFALWQAPLLGAGRETLTTVMQVEFLVIHSMGFLGLIGLWRPEDARGRVQRAIAFWGLFGLYCLVAIHQGSTYFVLFFGLGFATYLGLFMNWGSPSAQMQLVARWICGFVAYMIANAVFDTPRNVSAWTGRTSVIHAGALYFLGLAALELSGLYLRVIPRHAERIREFVRQAERAGKD